MRAFHTDGDGAARFHRHDDDSDRKIEMHTDDTDDLRERMLRRHRDQFDDGCSIARNEAKRTDKAASEPADPHERMTKRLHGAFKESR